VDFPLAEPNRTSLATVPWFKTQIDTTEDVGRHVSVAIDPISGATLISYHDKGLGGTLNLARPVESGGNCGPNNTWRCMILDSFGTVGEYNSIDTFPQANGTRVVISYYDFTHGALKYIDGHLEDSNFTWSIHTIDSGKPANGYYKGMHTSVKISPAAEPHIAYQYYSNYTGENQLFAYWRGDGSGNCGEGDVEGYWQCDTIYGGDGVGMYASLYHDQFGRPYIAFYDAGNKVPKVAHYLGKDGNCGPFYSWYCREVNHGGMDTGMYISLYIGQDQRPQIAYYNATNDTLEYAKYIGTIDPLEDIESIGAAGNCGYNNDSGGFDWKCSEIDHMGTSIHAMGVAITGDPDGNPVIAYQNASDIRAPAALMVARSASALDPYTVPNCGPGTSPSWYCQMIDRGAPDFDEAGAASIAVNSVGFATIAYHELDSYGYPADGNLKLAYQRLQLYLPIIQH
jgi:hypothetical protein